jgi:hypothetical protein
VVARSSAWVRAEESGILRAMAPLGMRVKKGSLLGMISDPFGEREVQINAGFSGVIIGRTNLPLINEGDALFHIARFERAQQAADKVEIFQEAHNPEPDEEPSPEGPII